MLVGQIRLTREEGSVLMLDNRTDQVDLERKAVF